MRRRLKFFSRRAVLCARFWGNCVFPENIFCEWNIWGARVGNSHKYLKSRVRDAPPRDKHFCSAVCVVVICTCRLQGVVITCTCAIGLQGGLIVVTSFSYMLHDVLL